MKKGKIVTSLAKEEYKKLRKKKRNYALVLSPVKEQRWYYARLP